MNSKNVQRIVGQLRAQADILEKQDGGEGTALSIAALCSSLLRISESITTGADVSESLYAQYLDLGARVEHFFASDAQCTESRENDIHTELLSKLSSSRKEAHHMRSRISEIEKEQLQMDEQIASCRRQLEEKEQENRQREIDHRDMQKMLAKYSPEFIEQSREENIRLAARLDTARNQFDTLKKQKMELLADIAEAERDIEGLPEENRQLAGKYHALKAEYEAVLHAGEVCSPEAQAVLRTQIEELRPVVEKNSQDAKILSARLEDLKSQNTVYCLEKKVLSTDIIGLISESLTDLEGKLVDHENRLTEIKATADAFSARVEACRSICNGYQNWLTANTTPLEVLCASVGLDESQHLRQSLDPASIARFGELKTQIEHGLRELDDLLARCADASECDKRNTNRRARI